MAVAVELPRSARDLWVQVQSLVGAQRLARRALAEISELLLEHLDGGTHLGFSVSDGFPVRFGPRLWRGLGH